jgi:hypothetical protein
MGGGASAQHARPQQTSRIHGGLALRTAHMLRATGPCVRELCARRRSAARPSPSATLSGGHAC